MERAYRNLGYFLLAVLPIFIAGFWIPYLSEILAFDPSITPPVHIHAVLLFSFIAILVFQPLAIRYRAFSVHRLLGKASYVVMAIVRIQERDVPAHMRYMIRIVLFLLPAGLARTLGYWFSVRQVTSQTISLAVIETGLAALIAFDIRRQLDARPYVVAFLAYNATAVVLDSPGATRLNSAAATGSSSSLRIQR